MATFIIYNEQSGEAEASAIWGPNHQVFLLTWNPEIKPVADGSTNIFRLLCSSEVRADSFSHLSPPFIFAEGKACEKLDPEKLLQCLPARPATAILDTSDKSAAIFCGLISHKVHPSTDFSTKEAFLQSLNRIFHEISGHASKSFFLPDNICSDSPEYKASKPRASVVIPLYNGLTLTQAMWKSVVQINGYSDYEYIFVDNCSTDGTREWLRTLPWPAVTILNSENRNFAGACNQGAAAARADYVIFLNNDTEVTDGWGEALIGILQQEPDVAVVGNRQLFPGTNLVHHAGIYFDLSGHPKHYLEGTFSQDPRINFRRTCVAVTGSCFAVRETEYLKAGGLCEEYRNGYEDIDFCLRMKQQGSKVVYTPQSIIYHHVSKSPGRGKFNASNWELFCSRWQAFLTPDLSEFIRENQNH